jgi:hypothetical protein
MSTASGIILLELVHLMLQGIQPRGRLEVSKQYQSFSSEAANK